MMNLNRVILGLAVACVLFAAPVHAQDKLQSLKKSMSQRLSTIGALMSNSKIGETWEGYLKGLKGVNLSEALTFRGKKTTIQKFIDAENADRKASYVLIAKKNTTPKQAVSAADVGVEAGTKYRKKFWKAGHSFLQKNGKWVKKPKRRR